MENKLMIFENEAFGKVRTLNLNGEPWFVAADVCKALELGNPSMTVERLDDDEKGISNAAMIDCDNGLPPILVIQPHETEQLAAASCSVLWGRKRVDSASCRRENAVFPVRRKPPMWARGSFHALTSSRQSARHPQGCISAPLLPRVLSVFTPLGAFFQILLCFCTLCDVIQEVLAFLLCHGFQLWHNAFHKAAK